MKASSYNKKTKVNIYSFFDHRIINRLRKLSGFCQRIRKIKPVDFLVGFFIMSLKANNTYSSWAEEISVLSKQTISKQSICEHIGKEALAFVKTILQEKLCKSYEREKIGGLFSCFKEVFIQDSTTLRLGDKLVKVFPGNHCAGKQRALARIQTIYSIKTSLFKSFQLSSYTQNDQGASALVLKYIQEGDLIIRDLGYFAIEVFKEIATKGAYFLSRLRYRVNLYDLKSKEQIDLYALLKKKQNNIDKTVLIGENKQLKARLVIRKLPEPLAAERRRKAKQNRDKRVNYNKEYYYLLGYSIYITNVEVENWTAQVVEKAYRMRWQIEIIFKSWKSHFNAQMLLHSRCQNRIRVECTIYLVLLFITLFQTVLYNYFKKRIRKKYKKNISLLKLAKFIANHIELILETKLIELEKYILKFCCYESRKDRVNINQTYQNAFC